MIYDARKKFHGSYLSMSEPALNYVHCPDALGGHRMAYWQWGDAANPHVVVCVHGISRQGRDFDELAKAMCDKVRVVCVDVVGRGASDWLKDPMQYQLPQYAHDMMALLPQLEARTIDWVGTSMGGLIGLAICGQEQSAVRRLVINDIGPVVQPLALERIASYIGADKRFATVQEGADYLWSLSTSFGPHTPAQWLAFSKPMLKADGAGFKLHYDPAISVPVKAAVAASAAESAAQGEALLWQLYDKVRAQTLLIRGADSDLLSPATAQAMAQRGPKARLIEFPGVGHAPTLLTPAQITPVVEFLLQ
jgi:pimeloyl-ACP methyl ester carboxylesterase